MSKEEKIESPTHTITFTTWVKAKDSIDALKQARDDVYYGHEGKTEIEVL